MNQTTDIKAEPIYQNDAEPVRHIRLHLRDGLYRALRHRLADAPPGVSISALIAELIETALDVTA
jgi:hypothetical protein